MRFAVEEQARRLEKPDQSAMSEAEIFKFICPNYQELIAEAMTKQKSKGNEEGEKDEDPFLKYQALATKLKLKDG